MNAIAYYQSVTSAIFVEKNEITKHKPLYCNDWMIQHSYDHVHQIVQNEVVEGVGKSCEEPHEGSDYNNNSDSQVYNQLVHDLEIPIEKDYNNDSKSSRGNTHRQRVKNKVLLRVYITESNEKKKGSAGGEYVGGRSN